MIGLLMIEQIRIPQEFISSMYRHFQKVGALGFEGVALWAGIGNGGSFDVHSLLIPEQELKKSSYGLSFSVSLEELHRINIWLYQNKIRLMAQIHSHPAEAYHSGIDDEYPRITSVGGLSIVVPDFGYSDSNLVASAIYRLQTKKGWIELSREQKDNLIKIIE